MNSTRASSSRLVGSRDECISSGETMAPRAWSWRVGVAPVPPERRGVGHAEQRRRLTPPELPLPDRADDVRQVVGEARARVAGGAGQELGRRRPDPGSAAGRRPWWRRTAPAPPGRAAGAPPRCRSESGRCDWSRSGRFGPERPVDVLERVAHVGHVGRVAALAQRPGVERPEPGMNREPGVGLGPTPGHRRGRRRRRHGGGNPKASGSAKSRRRKLKVDPQ